MAGTEYVDALKSAFPSQYIAAIEGLPLPTLHLLDAVIRFTSGGEWPSDATAEVRLMMHITDDSLHGFVT